MFPADSLKQLKKGLVFNMKKYFEIFVHRGLIFGGFGPLVLGIVYSVLQSTVENFSLNGLQVLIAIISVYLLAFVQAGATVFNQIESFSLPKSLFCHLSLLYVVYTACYLINDWIPFKAEVLLIFTAIFMLIYFTVWIIVYLSVKAVSRKLNARLN